MMGIQLDEPALLKTILLVEWRELPVTTLTCLKSFTMIAPLIYYTTLIQYVQNSYH